MTGTIAHLRFIFQEQPFNLWKRIAWNFGLVGFFLYEVIAH